MAKWIRTKVKRHSLPLPAFLVSFKNPIQNYRPKGNTIIRTMLSLKPTILLLGALAFAFANSGEIQPTQPGVNEPSWYCQWKRRVVYDRYSLEGRNWGVSEGELKKAVSRSNGAITGWKYDEDDEGGFKAAVSLLNFVFLLVREERVLILFSSLVEPAD